MTDPAPLPSGWVARLKRGAAHLLRADLTPGGLAESRCGVDVAPPDRWRPAPDRPRCRPCERADALPRAVADGLRTTDATAAADGLPVELRAAVLAALADCEDAAERALLVAGCDDARVAPVARGLRHAPAGERSDAAPVELRAALARLTTAPAVALAGELSPLARADTLRALADADEAIRRAGAALDAAEGRGRP